MQTAVAVATFVNWDTDLAALELWSGLSVLFCYNEFGYHQGNVMGFRQLAPFFGLAPSSETRMTLFWRSIVLENWVTVPESNPPPFKSVHPNEPAVLEFLTHKLCSKFPVAEDCLVRRSYGCLKAKLQNIVRIALFFFIPTDPHSSVLLLFEYEDPYNSLERWSLKH